MKVFADTNFLISLYFKRGGDVAQNALIDHTVTEGPVLISRFVELEMINAIKRIIFESDSGGPIRVTTQLDVRKFPLTVSLSQICFWFLSGGPQSKTCANPKAPEPSVQCCSRLDLSLSNPLTSNTTPRGPSRKTEEDFQPAATLLM